MITLELGSVVRDLHKGLFHIENKNKYKRMIEVRLTACNTIVILPNIFQRWQMHLKTEGLEYQQLF